MGFNSYETEIKNDEGSIIAAAIPATISSLNSTNVALGASATFTGDWEEVQNFSVVSVLIHSDQISLDEGIILEWSADGTNVHDTDTFSYEADEVGDGKFFTLPPEARYFRLTYQNGTTAQGSLTIQTIFRTVYIKPSSHRLDEVLTDQADAELVKAVISGKRPDGLYGDVSLTTTGRVRISNDPPQAPGGTVTVDITADSNVAGNTSTDNFHLIPSGKTLVIHSFNGGGATGVDGHVIELFDDVNGNGTGMTLIRVAFVGSSGGNFSFDLNVTITGDGTRGIRTRRTRIGGGSARIAAFWSGFEDA